MRYYVIFRTSRSGFQFMVGFFNVFHFKSFLESEGVLFDKRYILRVQVRMSTNEGPFLNNTNTAEAVKSTYLNNLRFLSLSLML